MSELASTAKGSTLRNALIGASLLSTFAIPQAAYASIPPSQCAQYAYTVGFSACAECMREGLASCYDDVDAAYEDCLGWGTYIECSVEYEEDSQICDEDYRSAYCYI